MLRFLWTKQVIYITYFTTEEHARTRLDVNAAETLWVCSGQMNTTPLTMNEIKAWPKGFDGDASPFVYNIEGNGI